MNRIVSMTELYTTLDISTGNYKNIYTIIDTSDYTLISDYCWITDSYNGYFRVFSYKEGSRKYDNTIALSRLVLNCPDGMEIDHINGNPLINAKYNLRICSHKDNIRNQTSHNQKVGKFKGVYKNGNGFIARIKHNGSPVYLGQYKTEVEAAKAYNSAAQILFGEFANLNNIK
jgi:hypothetical protein